MMALDIKPTRSELINLKRRIKQNDKTELLIFITPKVMDENLSVR